MKNINKISSYEVAVEAPPAKAYTLRALILGALAEGTTVIRKPLLGEDQLNLIVCLKGLGVIIKIRGDIITIEGSAGRFSPVTGKIDAGESGVAMNFLSSVSCVSKKDIIITGSPGLLKRPIKDIIDGVLQLGGEIDYLDRKGFPPIRVRSKRMTGGEAKISGKKNSQYLSSITTSAPLAENDVTIFCIDELTEKPYYDITLEMMSKFGVHAENENYKKIYVNNKQKYKAAEITIEGDYSSASYFFLAAAICGSRVTVKGLNRYSKQGDKRFLDLLKEMGCEIKYENNDICIKGNGLKAISADINDIPDMGPSIAIAAAFAKGQSKFSGAGHLRYKECDRLEAIKTGLTAMGVKARYDEDNLYIEGTKNIKGAEIDPFNDHRIAMSFAIAGLAVDGQAIKDEKCVAKSFPDFWEKMTIFYQ